MTEVLTIHQTNLDHHVQQGIEWLQASAGGKNTAALSYAALEFRFAVERLGVHYWQGLLNGVVEEKDLHDIQSFKRIERRIYDLGGHQLAIDRHFEFMRVYLDALKISQPLHTPNISALSRHWTKCSALCHIAWPLSSLQPGLAEHAYRELTDVATSLQQHVQSLDWPVIQDPALALLRDRFIAGTASREEVLAAIHHQGIWAKVEYTDGRPSYFIGQAVPPEDTAPDA